MAYAIRLLYVEVEVSDARLSTIGTDWFINIDIVVTRNDTWSEKTSYTALSIGITFPCTVIRYFLLRYYC